MKEQGIIQVYCLENTVALPGKRKRRKIILLVSCSVGAGGPLLLHKIMKWAVSPWVLYTSGVCGL